MNRNSKHYKELDTLIMEEGLMIVRPKNLYVHLAYINKDREVFLKDSNNLTNAEISYINDLAKNTPNPSLIDLNKGEAVVRHLEYHKEFTSAGFSGVLSNGNVVDRRIYPNAIPMQRNSMLGIPDAKINLE